MKCRSCGCMLRGKTISLVLRCQDFRSMANILQMSKKSSAINRIVLSSKHEVVSAGMWSIQFVHIIYIYRYIYVYDTSTTRAMNACLKLGDPAISRYNLFLKFVSGAGSHAAMIFHNTFLPRWPRRLGQIQICVWQVHTRHNSIGQPQTACLRQPGSCTGGFWDGLTTTNQPSKALILG